MVDSIYWKQEEQFQTENLEKQKHKASSKFY